MSDQGLGAHAPSRAMLVLWCIAIATPILCAFGLQWLPIINGPHLWVGLPTMLWWSTVPSATVVTLVLLLIEKTRLDVDEQDRLDDEAGQAAEVLEEKRS